VDDEHARMRAARTKAMAATCTADVLRFFMVLHPVVSGERRAD
jgi:hypothetical protein